MKSIAIFVTLALFLSSALAQTVVLGSNNSPWTVRQSTDLSFYNSRLQNPVVFQYGTVTVPTELWTYGLHAVAFRQLTFLYPSYRTFPIKSCVYTVYGPSRIYTFELLNGGGQAIKLYSSVQNNDEASGYQTQQTVTEEAKALINAQDVNKGQKVDDNNSGFSVIKLSRAYEIPRVALAIKQVTRNYWTQIRSAPLTRCLEKWERGTYSFRLYFSGVSNWFEFTHLGVYVSLPDEIEVVAKPQLRTETTTVTTTSTRTVTTAVTEEYLPRLQPIFTVKRTNAYGVYTLTNFRNHPSYTVITQKLNDHFGSFDEKWISKIQYRLDNDIHYFQFQVRFVPFLVDVDLEAHFYGSTRKAALLQIDEEIFNPVTERNYVENWTEIKNFNSYRSFREAHAFLLSQFTYLRLYTVKAAYSILYNSGRRIRFSYESQNHLFTPNGQQQFNFVVYICDGKYYVDREDFKATNTESSPKNNWVSLFVGVPDVKSHESYGTISRYFIANHWSFWNAHRIEEIRINNGIHIIRFRNPSPSVVLENQFRRCALRIVGTEVRILNHFDWVVVDESSTHFIKAVNYATRKYIGCVPIFINSKVTPYGRHFELVYLDEKRVFSNLYLRYVDIQDLITEDEWQGIAYTIDFEEVPLPSNPEDNLIRWVTSNHDDIVAVIDIKASSKHVYQCVALTGYQRWNFNINWIRGQWVLVNRELANDGYYFITGYPSIQVASCTGYLARLYPTAFVSGWLYSAIEVRNIGYFAYTRAVYKIGSASYQAVVRTTWGVENSHSLISWDRVRFIREKRDYGYGDVYDWSYGLSSRYFFDYVVAVPTVRVVEQKAQVIVAVVEKNNLLCAFYDNEKCIACYGDHYADNQGVCRKIEDSCLFWQVDGICSHCSYGWRVDSRGKCVAEVAFFLV